MFKPILVAACVISPLSVMADAPMQCDTNKMLQTTQKLFDYFCYTKDASFLENTLADTAKISYKANGKRFERNKTDYIPEITKALTENTISTRPLNVSYEIAGPNAVKLTAKLVEKRKGTGVRESGTGTYMMNLNGFYTFKTEGDDVKITRLSHTYTKTKLD